MKIKRLFFRFPDKAVADSVEPRVGGEDPIFVGEKAKEFGKRFTRPSSASPKPPTAPDPNATPEPNAATPPPTKPTQPTNEPPRRGFVKEQIDARKRAEQERDELKAKLDKYETEEKAALQKQIDELQGKVNSGELTAQKEREFEQRIESLVNEKTDVEKSYKEKVDKLQSRVSFYNLLEDPVYLQEYVAPIDKAQKDLISAIGNNQNAVKAMQRVLLANKQALDADSDEERQQYEDERDRMASIVYEGLESVKQGRFSEAYNRLLSATVRQAQSLVDHQRTTTELRKKASEEGRAAYEKTVQQWMRDYERVGGDFKDLESFGDDSLTRKAKELGIDVDLKESDAIARSVFSANPDRAKLVRFLHEGRIAPMREAKIKVQAAIIKELQETIDKMQAAKPNGSVPGSKRETAPTEPTNPEGKTRDQWQKKFAKPQQ